MASRTMFDIKVLTPGLVSISGSFAPNGAGAVDQTSLEGPINAVARTGVGVFEVTLKDKYLAIVSAFGSVQLNALADTDVQFGAWDGTTKKLIVRIKTAGVAADIAANANNRIHLALVMRNTSLKIKG